MALWRKNHPGKCSIVALPALILLLILCTMTFAVEFAGGTGDPNNPYQIATAEQLIAIGADPTLLDKHYILVADIDLDPNLPGGRIFDLAPIATPQIQPKIIHFVGCSSFTGTFDGAGRVICHLTIRADGPVDVYAGLFGCVGDRGRVRNLRLENADVVGGSCVGGLVGFSEGSIVACSVSGRIAGKDSVGAVVGRNEGLVSCCHGAGEVSANSAAGGLVGRHQTGMVAFSYSLVKVTGAHATGGLIGASEEGSVYLSYWDADVSGMEHSAGGRGRHTSQMMVRDLYRGWGYGGTWVLADGTDYPRLLWEGVEGQLIIDPPSTYGGGTGEPNTPFEIWSAEQLLSIGYSPGDFNDHFVLMADIDLSGTDPNLFVPIGTTQWPFAGLFDGNGHTISNLVCSLEGQSCVGLFGYIDLRSYSSVDRSRYYITPGAVKNLHLTNVVIRGGNCTGALVGTNWGYISASTITGAVAGLNRVGGLIGENKRELNDCHYSGTVDGNDCTGGLCGQNEHPGRMISCSATGTVRGHDTVGGLVGYTFGQARIDSCHAQSQVAGHASVGGLAGSNGSPLLNSFSVSSVTGQTRVGGLAGENWGDIQRCTCAGEVTGGDSVGGLVGYNHRNITSCYATASVTGDSAIGGLIGYNWEVATTMYCYAAGVVAGDGEDLGGLVGRDYYRGKFLLCYWDAEVSGRTNSQGGFGRSTQRMQQARTYRGWPANDWTIREGLDYPRLAWEQNPGQPLPGDAPSYGGGTGEPNDPYQIWTPQQFADIAHRPGDFAKCFVLMADIDMAGIDPDEMIPIGSCAAPFLGPFDGNGHTVSNFRCAYPGSPCMGIFGVLGWIGYSFQKPANVIAVITGLHVVDANLIGGPSTGGIVGISVGRIANSSFTGHVEGGDYTGGVLGFNSGEVNGVSCDIVVRGEKYVGGLVGCSKGPIIGSSSHGAVHGNNHRVGGLVGDQLGPLSACTSACRVDSSGSAVGGLAGGCTGEVTECGATGDVSGRDSVGGLIGGSSGTLRRCYATGQVVADGNAIGGLVGGSSGDATTTMTACYSTGAVRGLDRVGGLVGDSRGPMVDACYSRSDVRGRERVGGLVGMAYAPVYSSYARGSVTGSHMVGGLIGYNWKPLVKCYSTGRVAATGLVKYNYIHGLIGYSVSKEIDSCLWDTEASRMTVGALYGSDVEPSEVIGKTTAQMHKAATFIDAGWDFENVWMICEGRDYPRLRWEGVTCDAGD
jgi:hypothetical protein